MLTPAVRLLCFIVTTSITITSSTQNCDQLVHFRDVELYQQYNKVFSKYELHKEAINDMNRIREETLNEREWNKLMSVKNAATEGGLTTALIAQNIKTTCTLIGDLLKFAPATGVVGKVADKAILTAEKIYTSIKLGKSINSIVDEGAEKTAYKELLSNSGAVGQAVKTAWNYSEGIEKMLSMPADKEKLKKEVTRILDMVDNAVAKYQAALEKSSSRLTELNNIKIGIDKYLAENCKEKEKKEPNKPQKKEISVGEPSAPLASDKEVTGNSFYIFLSANLFVDGKHMTIISPPILHKGALTDAMIPDKEDFIEKIKLQLENRPKDFKQILSSNNYEPISIHYAKPYATSLLRSQKESLSAIEAFKQSIRDAVEGLPNANLIAFFQLN